MCGINGIVDPTNQMGGESSIQAMNAIISHRGPDDQGVYSRESVHLGHRRLSIIDVKTGSQPMSDRQKSLWIVYNGEVYNFKELRRDLQERGYVFQTKSDTEVIIHAYEEYGEKCVEKLRGMFAFAIWDIKKRQLFLARDRLGKKPLYYFFDGKSFVFASELKAILQVPGITKELEYSSVLDYFTYQYIPFPQSIFKRIHKLPPAHYLVARLVPSKSVDFGRNQVSSNGSLSEAIKFTVHKYWDLEFAPDHTFSERQWIDGIEEHLLEAVRIRMRSDVPIGAFLSGGVDSSAIVALMSKFSPRPVKTFSIVFDDAVYDESGYARMVAEQYSTDHHEFVVRPDAVDILPRLAWQFDEPFADPSALPTYYVSKMASEVVKVVLSGDGGDEAFAGYDWYGSFFRYKKYDCIPLSLRRSVLGFLAKQIPLGIRGKGTLKHMAESPFFRYAGIISSQLVWLHDKLLHEDVKKVIGGRTPGADIAGANYQFLKEHYDRFHGTEELSRLLYTDIKTYLAEDILTKVDRASMLCSLETRAPLLDHKFLEFLATMPAQFKLAQGEGKFIFKKAMEKYLPEKLLYRKKVGFDMPLSRWFKKDFLGYSHDILLSRRSRERNILNPAVVEKLLTNHQKNGRDFSNELWTLLFFEHWCLNWLD